jgi:hypothetical protein
MKLTLAKTTKRHSIIFCKERQKITAFRIVPDGIDKNRFNKRAPSKKTD